MSNIYSVSQVNHYISRMFAQEDFLCQVSVKGELSSVNYHSSGHIYFTIKDKDSQLSAKMWKSQRSRLRFPLENGMQVVATGKLEVYERGGSYSLTANKIEKLDQKGDLLLQYEALKRELEERGLFAPEYKQPIPYYARTIGVVTSPTGEAIHDIITNAKRRNPYVQIILYPAIVQGPSAPESIITGIRALERYGVDVMIVGRGGGSVEDLWTFNDPGIAQAIFDCSIPIISAVGHEPDTAISDFVADLRASTPTEAAIRATVDIRELSGRLEEQRKRADFAMSSTFERLRHRMQRAETRLIRQSPEERTKTLRERLARDTELLDRRMTERITALRHRYLLLLEQLEARSPINRLRGGYGFVTDADGSVVTQVSRLQPRDRITVRMSSGQILASVEEVTAMELGTEGRDGRG